MSEQTVHQRRRDALLTAAGFDEMLVFGNARVLGTGTQAFPAFYYLLGVDTGNGIALARIRRGAAPVVLSPNFFHIDDLKAGPPTDVEFAFAGWTEFGRAVADALQGAAAIGLVGRQEMPVRMWSTLAESVEVSRLVDLDSFLAGQRIVPDAVQLRDHRTAATIVDALCAHLPSLARAGEPSWMLQRRLEVEAMLRGADQCVCWMTTAPAADYYRTAKSVAMRVPEEGDQLLLGVMLTVNGAWGHGIRTYNLGQPRPELLSIHDRVLDIQTAVIALLRPGAPLVSVNDSIEAWYRQEFPESIDGARRFRTVHGLGFSYEEPATSPMFRQPFERLIKAPPAQIATVPGMLFEVHPNIFVPGTGGVAIGDMVSVGVHASEYVTIFPRDIHVI